MSAMLHSHKARVCNFCGVAPCTTPRHAKSLSPIGLPPNPLGHAKLTPYAIYRAPRTRDELFTLQRVSTLVKQQLAAKLAKGRYIAKLGSAHADLPDDWFLAKENAVPGPSPLVKKRYMSRGEHALVSCCPDATDFWTRLAMRSKTFNSWTTAKSACLNFLAAQMAADKRTIDHIGNELMLADKLAEPKRTQEREAAQGRYNAALKRMPLLVNVSLRIPDERPAIFSSTVAPGKGSLKRVLREGKSRSARHAPANCRETIADALPPEYRLLWLLQCASGCRPQELANGIAWSLLPNGEVQLVIHGAKIGTHAGQARRMIRLSHTEDGIVRMLADQLRSEPRSHVQMSIKVNTYGQAIRRCSLRVFPTKDKGKIISAYTARHLRKAEWKKAKVNRVELAKAMGHRTTRSAVYYGANVRCKSVAVKPIAVQATNAVKVREKIKNKKTRESSIAPSAKRKPKSSMS